jgi:hypothetical protein
MVKRESNPLRAELEPDALHLLDLEIKAREMQEQSEGKPPRSISRKEVASDIIRQYVCESAKQSYKAMLSATRTKKPSNAKQETESPVTTNEPEVTKAEIPTLTKEVEVSTDKTVRTTEVSAGKTKGSIADKEEAAKGVEKSGFKNNLAAKQKIREMWDNGERDYNKICEAVGYGYHTVYAYIYRYIEKRDKTPEKQAKKNAKKQNTKQKGSKQPQTSQPAEAPQAPVIPEATSAVVNPFSNNDQLIKEVERPIESIEPGDTSWTWYPQLSQAEYDKLMSDIQTQDKIRELYASYGKKRDEMEDNDEYANEVDEIAKKVGYSSISVANFIEVEIDPDEI